MLPVPDQSPWPASSVCPSWAVPSIDGFLSFVGPACAAAEPLPAKTSTMPASPAAAGTRRRSAQWRETCVSIRPLSVDQSAYDGVSTHLWLERRTALVKLLYGSAPLDELVERLAVCPGAPLLGRVPRGIARARGVPEREHDRELV